MGILRTRMEQDLVVRGRSAHTRRAYLRAVTDLAKYYHRSPDELSDRELRAYLCHLIEALDDTERPLAPCPICGAPMRIIEILAPRPRDTS